MNKTKGFLYAAGMVFAMAFTLSCSSDGGSGGGGGGSSSSEEPSGSSSSEEAGVPSSSSGNEEPSSSSSIEEPGSSSAVPSSSSSDGSNTCTADFGEVQIGSQVWAKKNLNCDVEGSKCYDDDPAKCAEYGRLYNWATATALPSSCNENTCSSQIQSKHRGICPSGWHIPSNAEWDMLVAFAGGSGTAGTKLKAVSGWNSYSGIENLDTYGFSALPGGYGNSDGSFGSAGNYGDWWSATESLANYAYNRSMSYSYGGIYGDGNYKSFLQSVRCVKNSSAEPSSSSVAVSSSSAVPSSSSVIVSSSSSVPSSSSFGGSNTCTADFGEVQIGSQVWAKKNLNCDVEGSKCCSSDPYDCMKLDYGSGVWTGPLYDYGLLYDWATAMNLPPSCNSSSCSEQIQTKHRGICPAGWHIPSKAEWEVLFEYAGGVSKAGEKLKATSGWQDSNINGTDDYGFSALLGGAGAIDGSTYSFYNLGIEDFWWSASEYSNGTGAHRFNILWSKDVVYWSSSNKGSNLFSVRCVRD